MRYLPHTEADVAAMLDVIGAKSVEELFDTVADDCRRERPLDLPAPASEWDLTAEMEALAGTMAPSGRNRVFMGAGSYHHFIPATVGSLLGRSEFSTAYTPYQPEISQGTLQAIFEYQTLTARLLGMEVANASMYDGASALAEGLLMALRAVKKKTRVAVSRAIHPHYRKVVETYLAPTEFSIVTLDYDPVTGKTDLSSLSDSGDLAAVAIQSPNFFGCIEDLSAAADAIHAAGGLLVAGFTEPMAFGMLKNPGSQGADIVCGEGQSFGIPQSFGGPGLGMFAANKKHVRTMPGRLVGQTLDMDGNRGFVLTLATREQHIRREKATSNICSNQGLCATASAMYMASVGNTGIRALAKQNRNAAEYLKARLLGIGFTEPFTTPTFNEFVLEAPKGFAATWEALLASRTVAGLPLQKEYPELCNHYLFCATETASKEEMDALVAAIQKGGAA